MELLRRDYERNIALHAVGKLLYEEYNFPCKYIYINYIRGETYFIFRATSRRLDVRRPGGSILIQMLHSRELCPRSAYRNLVRYLRNALRDVH